MGFPTEFPSHAIPQLIAHFSVGNPFNRGTAEAAYDLLGYLGHVSLPLAVSTSEKPKNEEVVACLKAMDKSAKDGESAAAFSIPPWMVTLLMGLLNRWLAGGGS